MPTFFLYINSLNNIKVNIMKINTEYKYFVLNADSGLIVAGNEYKEDALEVRDEFNEDVPYPNNIYKVHTAVYLKRLGIDAFNPENWTHKHHIELGI